MVQRRLTGELAWARLLETLAGATVVELGGETVPFAAAFNQLSDQTVQTLIEAVKGRYDIAWRWCRLKAGLFGCGRLAECDLSAPVAAVESRRSYGAARELVLAVGGECSPTVAALAARFFDEHWIAAPVREGKLAGAFCEGEIPGLRPSLPRAGRRLCPQAARLPGRWLLALAAAARPDRGRRPGRPRVLDLWTRAGGGPGTGGRGSGRRALGGARGGDWLIRPIAQTVSVTPYARPRD